MPPEWHSPNAVLDRAACEDRAEEGCDQAMPIS